MSHPAVPNQSRESGPKMVAEALLSSSILEAIPDAVAAVNQQGIIIQVNSQTESLFGYTREELIGQKVESWCRSGSGRSMIRIASTSTSNPRFAAWGPGSISPADAGIDPNFQWRSALVP
jgi:transcriptional regulator with PAS, ATPase and Fis domain